MVAAILLEGKLSFELAHDYGRFQNSRVLALKQKVQLIADAELERSAMSASAKALARSGC